MVSLILKPISPLEVVKINSNIDKNSKFYFVKWEKQKVHCTICEIKAGDKLTFVTGLCSGLVKSKGIYNLEEGCPHRKKRRGGCCALSLHMLYKN